MNDDELILHAWDAVSDDAALARLLAHLAAAFGCNSAALVYKDRLTPAADITVAHGPFDDAAVQRRYALEYAELDPAPAAMARLAIGEVADTDSLFPLEDRDRYRAFLDGFYHPLGLAGALGAPLSKGESRIGMVAVHRDMARPPFDAADADRLRRLVPHLARMIEMRQMFFQLGSKVARIADALETVAAAIMILDQRGVLLEANQVARSLFARRDGLVLTRGGQVVACDTDAARALREALSPTGGGGLVRVPRDVGSGPYVLRVSRRREPPGWKIVASESKQVGRSRPDQLASALGLPSGAAELLAALLEGETLKSYCELRSLSRNTAKYHLRAAFLATGTHRQADLVRHAIIVARDLGL